MREIEFRGRLIKDQYGKKKGEWVYGYFYEEDGNIHDNPELMKGSSDD